MIHSQRPARPRPSIVAAVAVAALALGLPRSADAATPSDRAGVWTVAQDGGPRQCRIQIRTDPLGTGMALAMPPGCHRALPVLATVRSWTAPDDTHVAFNDEAGQAILIFGDQAGSASLHADGAEGGAGYTLTPAGVQARRTAAGSGGVPSPAPGTAVAAAPATPVPPMSLATVAGNYAVLRGDRDTGCMVTLDEKTRGPKSSLKAHLAPACRDQGIVIFDPIGWQLEAGRLVLTARKGHTTDLDRTPTGLWSNEAKGGKPLTLKRL